MRQSQYCCCCCCCFSIGHHQLWKFSSIRRPAKSIRPGAREGVWASDKRGTAGKRWIAIYIEREGKRRRRLLPTMTTTKSGKSYTIWCHIYGFMYFLPSLSWFEVTSQLGAPRISRKTIQLTSLALHFGNVPCPRVLSVPSLYKLPVLPVHNPIFSSSYSSFLYRSRPTDLTDSTDPSNPLLHHLLLLLVLNSSFFFCLCLFWFSRPHF